MKKILKLALVIGLVSIACVMLLTSCECKHKDTEWKVTAPNCKNLTDGKEELCCKDCGVVLETVVLPAAHKPVTVEGKAATCNQEGLTEGIECSVCGAELVKQQIIAITDHEYTNDADMYCNVCGGERPRE